MRCVLVVLAFLAAHGEAAAQAEQRATPSPGGFVVPAPVDEARAARPREAMVTELAECERELGRAGTAVAGGLLMLTVGAASIPSGVLGAVWGIFAAGTCDVGCGVGIGVGSALAIAAIIGGALIARGGNQTKLLLLPRREQVQLELGLHANGLALTF
jgi:hypothetical protein